MSKCCSSDTRVISGNEKALEKPRKATKASLLSAIQSCGRTKNLAEARRLHSDATVDGNEPETYFACSLIAMYANCGSMVDARRVFNSMRSHDAMAWNALMLGYVENGEPDSALQLFDSMVTDGCPPTARLYVTVIKACTTLAAKETGKLVNGKAVKVKALEEGASIHLEAERKRLDDDIYVASSLVGMYAKCGSMSEARRVFDGMATRSVVTWNTLILGYVENGESRKALTLYDEMKTCSPNARTFVALLKVCTVLSESEPVGSLEKGMALHSQAAERRFDVDLYVSSALVVLYSKCGSVEDAETVFDRMTHRDIVVWTALVLGYCKNGQSEAALNLFAVMQQELNNKADARAFVAALKACTCLAEQEKLTRLEVPVKHRALEICMAIHALSRKQMADRNIYVSNSLVDCYAKCGSFLDAQRVFATMSVRDTVSWNVLIQALVDRDESGMALELYLHMQREGVPVDEQTLAAATRACASMAAREESTLLFDEKLVKVKSLEQVMALHSMGQKLELKPDTYMVNQLVETYARCGSLLDARRAFDSLNARSTSSCNAMMQGYLDSEMNEQVLELHVDMVNGESSPDYRSYAMALKACAGLSDDQTGKAIHGETCRRGLESDPAILTGLVDLYGKSGKSSLAQEVFASAASEVPVVATWNVLLAGFARQGDSSGVFRVFNEMVEAGLQPNCVTLLMVLGSCRHAGLVEQGKKLFCDMRERYGVTPDIEHFHSMLDLLGRANQLDEALSLVNSMPYKRNAVTWTTVLNSCLRWKNVEVGRYAFDALVQLEGKNGAPYVLMASLYESVDMREESRRITEMGK